MTIKTITTVVGLFLFSIASIGSVKEVGASTRYQADAVINERWGKPTFVYGAGLNESQIVKTRALLGIEENDVKESRSTGQDLIKYLGYGSGDDSAMISSVVVSRENKGHGITVDIKTPEQITLITADQYKNPLVTAGITDATISVASVSKVTGESALTGVYKAFEKNGEAVDPKRTELAQKELDTTTDVAQNIIQQATEKEETFQKLDEKEQEQAKEAYKTNLNQTLIDIKQQLAELKKGQEQLVSKEDLAQIVEDALKRNHLTRYITPQDTTQLVHLADQYQQVNGVLDKEALNQLDQISQELKGTMNDLTNKLGSVGEKITGSLSEHEGFFRQLWEKIKTFFKTILNK